jgi:hypothetical protein
MKATMLKTLGLLALGTVLIIPTTFAAEVEAGFTGLFNGTDLKGWEGNMELWSVEDGVITGQTTKEKPAKGNTFLIWKGGSVDDFELRLSYKFTVSDPSGFGNSGVQYRSKIADPVNWVVGGYQADMETGTAYSGILYEERGRGILAQRGQMVNIDADGKIRQLGVIRPSAEIQAGIKKEDWNDYVIIARGNHITHIINGQVTVDVTDDQVAKRAKSGVMALQLHAGPPMKIQFKNIRIKPL